MTFRQFAHDARIEIVSLWLMTLSLWSIKRGIRAARRKRKKEAVAHLYKALKLRDRARSYE